MNDRPSQVPDDIWSRYAARAERTPWRIITACLLVALVAGYLASHLEMRADIAELLPTEARSVKDLEHVKSRIASFSTLAVASSSADLPANQRFVEDLVARLKTWDATHDEPWIDSVEYTVKEAREYAEKWKHLFVDAGDLEILRDRIDTKIKEQTAYNSVEHLDEDDETDKPRPLHIDDLKAKYESKTKDLDRYPGGYLGAPDREDTNKWLLAVLIHPPSKRSTTTNNRLLVAEVERIVDALHPGTYARDMVVGTTGDIKTGIEEHDTLVEEVLVISLLAFFGVIAVIVIYFRSIRSVLLIGFPMLLGAVAAFGLGQVAIGYLNSSTAFLGSIIAGNGINFGIILLARYFEERSRGVTVRDGLAIAMRETWRATLVASLAASIAYGSLMVTAFRGFSQFGVIGFAGMVFCWLFTFVVSPPVIVINERIRTLAGRTDAERNRPLSNLAALGVRKLWPALIGLAVALTASTVTFAIGYFEDPFEYNFYNLRNRDKQDMLSKSNLSSKVDDVYELPASPMVIMADAREDVPEIVKALREHPEFPKLASDVRSLDHFLPKDQPRKLAVLAQIRELIDKKIDFLPAEDRKRAEEYRPPDYLRPITIDDLPESVARPWSEAGGVRGRVVLVYKHQEASILNGRYLLKFAKYVRDVHLPDGRPILVVGQPLIFADMIASILEDGRRASLASILGVVLLIILAYRSLGSIVAIGGAVLLGTAWLVGVAAFLDVKTNFVNFIALPITLGIGVDYSVNVWQRYRLDGRGTIARAVAYTGGAVTLCSLTTIIGYATLLTSRNLALNSFGMLAVIGEVTCLATAIIVLPAFVMWRDRKLEARA